MINDQIFAFILCFSHIGCHVFFLDCLGDYPIRKRTRSHELIDLQVMKLRPSCFHWRMRNGVFIATRCVPFDAWPENMNGLFESILNVGVFLTHEQWCEQVELWFKNVIFCSCTVLFFVFEAGSQSAVFLWFVELDRSYMSCCQICRYSIWTSFLKVAWVSPKDIV